MKDYVATSKSSQEPDMSLKLITFSAFTKINWSEINNIIDRLMNNLSKLQLLTSVRSACHTWIKTAQDFKEILIHNIYGSHTHMLWLCYVSNIGVTCFPEISGHVTCCLLHVLWQKMLAGPRNRSRNLHMRFFPHITALYFYYYVTIAVFLFSNQACCCLRSQQVNLSYICWGFFTEKYRK